MTSVERLIAHDSAVLRCELAHAQRRRRGRMRGALAYRNRCVPLSRQMARRWTP